MSTSIKKQWRRECGRKEISAPNEAGVRKVVWTYPMPLKRWAYGQLRGDDFGQRIARWIVNKRIAKVHHGR